MAHSPQNELYRISPLEFIQPPMKLPQLAPSKLNDFQTKASEIQVRSNRNLQWLWLFPAAYFALGGLLSFSTVMAQSIVPVMAEQEAQEKASIIRLVVDDFQQSNQQARSAKSSNDGGSTVTLKAIHQEEFMESAPTRVGNDDSLRDAAVYTYTLQGNISDDSASNSTPAFSSENASKKKYSPEAEIPTALKQQQPSLQLGQSSSPSHPTLSAFQDADGTNNVEVMIQQLRQARAIKEAKQRADAERQAALQPKHSEASYSESTSPQQAGAFSKPLARLTLSSPFGPRWGRMHEGSDFSASTGTPIFSANAGKVTFAGRKGGYGLLVVVDHGNGVETRYGHCSKLLVQKGDAVQSGDRVGLVGSTGNSTGPHLHFEVRANGQAKNPFAYLNA
jgi:murein DD-endopeptidase MepM/ murein hydrolase activator NlpD